MYPSPNTSSASRYRAAQKRKVRAGVFGSRRGVPLSLERGKAVIRDLQVTFAGSSQTGMDPVDGPPITVRHAHHHATLSHQTLQGSNGQLSEIPVCSD